MIKRFFKLPPRVESFKAVDTAATSLGRAVSDWFATRDVPAAVYRLDSGRDALGARVGLIDHADNLIDTAKETMHQFDVEQPYVPADLNHEYKVLTEMCVESAELIVKASRSFFKDLHGVKDYIHKVYFYEKEAP